MLFWYKVVEEKLGEEFANYIYLKEKLSDLYITKMRAIGYNPELVDKPPEDWIKQRKSRIIKVMDKIKEEYEILDKLRSS